MKYPKIELGTVEAVWNKLGGEEAVKRFLRDELVVMQAEDSPIKYHVVRLGLFNTAEEYHVGLKDAHLPVSRMCKELLSAVEYADHKREVRVVIVTARELGFDRPASYAEICTEAVDEVGYELCPAEVGPAFAIESDGVLGKGPVKIAMKPLEYRGTPSFFVISSSAADHPGLHGHAANTSAHDPDTRFAFIDPE